jgi:hypothetical protein
MPKMRILPIMVLTGALATALSVSVLAQTPVFSPLKGSVLVDGAAVPVGTQVQIFIGTDSSARASVITSVAGHYEVLVSGTTEDVGKILSFKVEGLDATSTPASPRFAAYEPQTVDLEVVVDTPRPRLDGLAITGIMAAVVIAGLVILLLVKRRDRCGGHRIGFG